MGALGASLLCMVSRITLRKKDRSAETENLRDVIERCERLRETLLMLTVEDTEAFNRVMQAFKIAKERSEERKKAVQETTLKAAQVPLSTMEASLEMLKTAEKVAMYGKSIIGFSTLFTSNLSRFMSRLERRLFHRSVAHYESASPRKVTPLNLTPVSHYCLTSRVRENTRPVLYLHESYLAVSPIHQGRDKEG